MAFVMKRILPKVVATCSARGMSQSGAAQFQENTIGFQYNKKFREFPHRMLWRRKDGTEESSWNQCKKSHEALATNFEELQIGDRALILSDCDAHLINLSLAIQKRGAQCSVVPINGLTTAKLEKYIEQIRPKVIFLTKDKFSVTDPMSSKGKPEKMTLDVYSMLWKIFPISTLVEGQPLQSKRYRFVQRIVLCDQEEALNQHDMITNIKYYETYRDQGYYDSPLVHIAMYLTADMPALTTLGDDGKWTVHSHRALVTGGHLFAEQFFGKNERVIVLPGCETKPCGFLTMFACLQAHAAICFGEDQLITEGDCIRVTRAVYTHEATMMAGSKNEWEHLLKYGDAPTKLADTQKSWFKSLQWAVLFLDDVEPVNDLDTRIKAAFGIERVEIVRGSADALNFMSFGNGQHPAGLEFNVKDRKDLRRSPTDTTPGQVWVKGPHVSSLYWNNIGLMTVPVDADNFVKFPFLGTVKENKLQITTSSPLEELVI